MVSAEFDMTGRYAQSIVRPSNLMASMGNINSVYSEPELGEIVVQKMRSLPTEDHDEVACVTIKQSASLTAAEPAPEAAPHVANAEQHRE